MTKTHVSMVDQSNVEHPYVITKYKLMTKRILNMSLFGPMYQVRTSMRG